jgi:tyrosyl-tRNA synthetase
MIRVKLYELCEKKGILINDLRNSDEFKKMLSENSNCLYQYNKGPRTINLKIILAIYNYFSCKSFDEILEIRKDENNG